MKILDIIPLTKIPMAQPQILSYFSGADLSKGAIVEAPLGRRKETGVVFDSHEADDLKMEIKKAGYELRPLTKVISEQPILTRQQIELALWLGQYYFAPPGLFAKMMMPKKIKNDSEKLKIKKSQKLILAPTVSFAERIAKEYKNSVIWHSELSKKQLNGTWWRVKNGKAQTIIGTRSAVFLPFANLKEIIIEDETNPAHRSWDMFPHYRVHEATQKLTEIFGAKLILKSEVPSVDYFYRLQEGRRQTVSGAPASRRSRAAGQGWRGWPRTNGLPAPKPTIITDMRAELKDGNFSIFSRALQSAISDVLAQEKQVILFINRRGAANFVLCRDCGYVAKCKNCEAPLAYHLMSGRPVMFCHRCGYKEIPPELCPKCQSYRIKTMGTGTQKVELEAQKIFPTAKISRLDSDSAPGAKEQQKIIDVFLKKEADILIATQIIFSWLEEIKSATLGAVALISADTLLHLPDFQSGERTFQTIISLLHLLCHSERSEESPANAGGGTDIRSPRCSFGEAGRRSFGLQPQDDEQRLFFIQTYNPENSVIKYAAKNDWQSFYQEEIEARKTLGYPPFSQIVKLTFRHKDPKKAGTEAKILAAKLTHAAGHPELTQERHPELVSEPAPNLFRGSTTRSRNEFGMTKPDKIQISDALPAFIPRERGKYIWNIIIKFKISGAETKTSSEFLRSRNSLLQYVPSNWEIDVNPSDML